ncbi:hypothetical protein WJX72_009227 [[Myrmecia] bisecta]|uniref:C2H2-type domain-containing protein n=1 Tax=[Myrmecia] bisecta TaxID=41462 RepID=A0AAW1QS32_9CHLO
MLCQVHRKAKRIGGLKVNRPKLQAMSSDPGSEPKKLRGLSKEERARSNFKDPNRFYCPHPNCDRSFGELWRLKVHYRAAPDIRGSGRERGHGGELDHCPKCGQELLVGKHHVGCVSGRAAPRQAAKRMGTDDGDGMAAEGDYSDVSRRDVVRNVNGTSYRHQEPARKLIKPAPPTNQDDFIMQCVRGQAAQATLRPANGRDPAISRPQAANGALAGPENLKHEPGEARPAFQALAAGSQFAHDPSDVAQRVAVAVAAARQVGQDQRYMQAGALPGQMPWIGGAGTADGQSEQGGLRRVKSAGELGQAVKEAEQSADAVALTKKAHSLPASSDAAVQVVMDQAVSGALTDAPPEAQVVRQQALDAQARAYEAALRAEEATVRAAEETAAPPDVQWPAAGGQPSSAATEGRAADPGKPLPASSEPVQHPAEGGPAQARDISNSRGPADAAQQANLDRSIGLESEPEERIPSTDNPAQI